MYAYQQLSMERLNDALAIADGKGTGIGGGLERPRVLMSDPAAVEEHVLPAVEEKIRVLRLMDDEHAAVGRPSSDLLGRVYDDFSALLSVVQQRASEQQAGFIAWSQDPSLDVESFVSQSDSTEMAAMTRSATSLNELIAETKMSRDDWLDLVCAVFNEVRMSINLSPIPNLDFRERYLVGLTGSPTRFFRD